MAKQLNVTTIECDYDFNSEKKGSWRYDAKGGKNVTSSIYLPKKLFPEKPGDKLTLDITIRERK